MYVSQQAESPYENLQTFLTPVQRLARANEKYFSFANFCLYHQLSVPVFKRYEPSSSGVSGGESFSSGHRRSLGLTPLLTSSPVNTAGMSLILRA